VLAGAAARGLTGCGVGIKDLTGGRGQRRRQRSKKNATAGYGRSCVRHSDEEQQEQVLDRHFAAVKTSTCRYIENMLPRCSLRHGVLAGDTAGLCCCCCCRRRMQVNCTFHLARCCYKRGITPTYALLKTHMCLGPVYTLTFKTAATR
jgi:hypothetical protein